MARGVDNGGILLEKMEIGAGRGLANNAYQNECRRLYARILQKAMYKDCRDDCRSKEMDARRLQGESTAEDGGINLIALRTKET